MVESNLVRDKQTKAPKGVAFAWFRTRAQVSIVTYSVFSLAPPSSALPSSSML